MPWLPPPPLALLEGLGPLLLVVFWVIRQILTAKNEAREKAEREEGVDLENEPALEGAAQARAAGPAAERDEVRSEVEEFLKRVNQMRRGEDPDADADDEPPRRRGPIDPFEEPVRRPRAEPRPQIEVLVEPEPTLVEATPEPAPRQSLAAAAAARTAVNDITEHADRLGSQIAQSDERLEERLHQKFDHQLGAIAARDSESSSEEPKGDEPQSAAARVRSLLASPTGVRDAIVVNEVLRRRDDLI